MAIDNPLIVFAKPWKTETIGELAALVKSLGFQGIELPVRDGYRVNPSNFEEALPGAAALFQAEGLRILSVAGDLDERLVACMGRSGAGILRVMLAADPAKPYLEQEEAWIRRIQALLPVLEAGGVKLGVQNHYGNFVGCSAAGLMRVVGRFPANLVGAVLDLAHCAIAGEIVEFALDIAASHLALVNLKNGYRGRTNFPTAGEAEWRTVWTTSPHGALSWRKVAEELRRREYRGPVCLTAEYSGTLKPLEEEEVLPLLREDLEYLSSL